MKLRIVQLIYNTSVFLYAFFAPPILCISNYIKKNAEQFSLNLNLKKKTVALNVIYNCLNFSLGIFHHFVL